LNVYGLAFGATNLTLFDADDEPISILVRVTLDTQDLQARIKQIYPSTSVRVIQVGPQVILEGQVPDSKSMAEVLQLVESELLGGYRSTGGTGGAVRAGPAVSSRDEPKRDDVKRASFQQGPGAPVV